VKIITWNVNGIRACLGKGFLEYVQSENADIICIQETKMQEGQATVDLPGYLQYWNSAEKKGYSGTAVFTKTEPQEALINIGVQEHGTEGRSLALEYPLFYIITNYTPNSQDQLARLDYRLKWETDNREFLRNLDQKKPLILCGDLNVAPQEIDLKNPSSNRRNAGFTDEERDAFSKLLSAGFVDAYRHLYPDKTEAYTWWSYRFRARERNAGWRIDHFVVSERLAPQIRDVIIRDDIMGSDHCPVVLDIEL
jgi:exodeoxyribonuclease-3